jgi:hypothetical protein
MTPTVPHRTAPSKHGAAPYHHDGSEGSEPCQELNHRPRLVLLYPKHNIASIWGTPAQLPSCHPLATRDGLLSDPWVLPLCCLHRVS